jgi:hypothetical protein
LAPLSPGQSWWGLFVYWVAAGHSVGRATASDPAVSHVVKCSTTPCWLSHIAGLGALAFPGNIMLLFAGVEAQEVHVRDMKSPRRGFPAAMLLVSLGART